MSTSLSLPALNPLVRAELEGLVEEVNALLEARHAASTRRAYLSDFASFEAWCAQRGLPSMPAAPGTVALYLTALHKMPVATARRAADAGDPEHAATDAATGRPRSFASIERALAGIVHAHRTRGFAWPRSEPILTRVMASLRKKLGASPRHQRAPVDDRDLAALLATTGDDLVGLRDRALLTLGWLGAFRRSELVALRVDDITRAPSGGLHVRVRSSKTDQDGVGEYVGIAMATNQALCAVRALDAWLAASGIREGFIFRAFHKGGRLRDAPLCDRAVAIIVKRAAARAGIDPAKLAGHSLRAGFATTASIAGKSKSAIAAHLRHKSETTTTRYVRPCSVLEANPTAGLV